MKTTIFIVLSWVGLCTSFDKFSPELPSQDTLTMLRAPSSFVKLNNKILFRAYNSSVGFELWCIDGTRAGTYLVKDISSGSKSGFNSSAIVYGNVHGNKYFFLRQSDLKKVWYNDELWVSNGSNAGTKRIAIVDSSFEYNMVHGFNDKIIISQIKIREPLRHYGKISLIDTVSYNSISSFYFPKYGGIYHIESVTNNSAIFAQENRWTLYRTNGTLEGTFLIFENSNERAGYAFNWKGKHYFLGYKLNLNEEIVNTNLYQATGNRDLVRRVYTFENKELLAMNSFSSKEVLQIYALYK